MGYTCRSRRFLMLETTQRYLTQSLRIRRDPGTIWTSIRLSRAGALGHGYGCITLVSETSCSSELVENIWFHTTGNQLSYCKMELGIYHKDGRKRTQRRRKAVEMEGAGTLQKREKCQVSRIQGSLFVPLTCLLCSVHLLHFSVSTDGLSLPVVTW